MNINYDHYKFFYWVAKCGNVTAAAQKTNHNQPNITRVIKSLESQLGLLLFQRSKRGMILTPEGEKLFELLAPAIERIILAETEIAADASLANGLVSLGVTEIGLRCFLLPVLKKFRVRYPGVHLRIYNHSTMEAVESVACGLSDLAVITTPLKKREELAVRELKTFREHLICGKTFEYLSRRSCSIRDLSGIPFISLGQKSATYACYAQFFEEQGIDFKPEIIVETADQILPLVKNGIGIGFLPAELISLDEKEIYPIHLHEDMPLRSICLVKKAEGSLNLAATAFETLSLQYSEIK